MWLKSKKKKKKTKRRNRRKHRDGWGLAGRFLMLIMDPHATRRFHPTHQCTGCPAIHLFFNLFLESVCLLGVMAALEEMESSPLFISACSPQWGSPRSCCQAPGRQCGVPQLGASVHRGRCRPVDAETRGAAPTALTGNPAAAFPAPRLWVE